MTGPFRGSAVPLTRGQLRTARYRREAQDVYVLASTPSSLLVRCRALQVAVPDGVVSHATAARLLRLPLPGHVDVAREHLTRPPGSAPVRRPGVTAHVRALAPDEVCLHLGVRVTAPARVVLDLAPVLGLQDLVVLGDAVQHRLPAGALAQAVAAAVRRRGVQRARASLARVDAGSGSPGETRVRLLLHDAGFRALRHGVVVRDALGGWLAEPDLADPDARVAVQYDGLVHHEGGPQRWQGDVDRDELSRQAGWEVVVLTGRDLRLPHLGVAKVAGAYARAEQRRLGAALLAQQRPAQPRPAAGHPGPPRDHAQTVAHRLDRPPSLLDHGAGGGAGPPRWP